MMILYIVCMQSSGLMWGGQLHNDACTAEQGGSCNYY